MERERERERERREAWKVDGALGMKKERNLQSEKQVAVHLMGAPS